MAQGGARAASTGAVQRGVGGLEGRLAGTRTLERFRTAAETGTFAVRTIRLAARPPFTWVPDAVVEASTVFRRCAIPLFISCSIYLATFGAVLFGAIAVELGLYDRAPGGEFVGELREISTWVTMMIVAGIAGSALTADIGARKIRQELDAMTVLGVDTFKSVVVPRVLGMTVAALILSILSLFISSGVAVTLGSALYDSPIQVGVDGIKRNILSLDVFAALIKHTLMGFFVGVIACQKGFSVRGGSEGVGRAVNEAVVITFFGIWIFNSMYNLAYLSLFPQLTVPLG